MKLPDGLAKRYPRMDDAMGGDAAARALLDAGMLKAGGRPGPIAMPDSLATNAILRPGVINWDDSMDFRLSFNIKKGGSIGKIGAKGLDLDKLLQSKYIQKDMQGRDVREFTSPKATPAEAAVSKAEAKVIAKVEAKVEAKAVAEAKGAAKAAAKVEAKATALAAKAKATKEKALEGLGYYGYYLGEDPTSSNQLTEAHVNPGKLFGGISGLLIGVAIGAAIGWFAHQKLA